MIRSITARNVNVAFVEALWWMKTAGLREQSRNGPVLVAPDMVITEYLRPWERVLFNAKRDANAVFHLMEALWMLTGSQDVTPLLPFNAGMARYTEDGKLMHGAYGHRWMEGFGLDQVDGVIEILTTDPTSRQAVLAMWDPMLDLTPAPLKDRPCNTHIYFDCRGGKLNMTVCCRSNDMLWGAYGANVVHMSVLQEVIAAGVGVPMGVYRQVSNNFHLYLDLPVVQEFIVAPPYHSDDQYAFHDNLYVPLIAPGEVVYDFIQDCHTLLFDDSRQYRTKFITEVADPLKSAYLARRAGEPYSLATIRWCDWKLAFHDWLERRKDVK